MADDHMEDFPEVVFCLTIAVLLLIFIFHLSFQSFITNDISHSETECLHYCEKIKIETDFLQDLDFSYIKPMQFLLCCVFFIILWKVLGILIFFAKILFSFALGQRVSSTKDDYILLSEKGDVYYKIDEKKKLMARASLPNGRTVRPSEDETILCFKDSTIISVVCVCIVFFTLRYELSHFSQLLEQELGTAVYHNDTNSIETNRNCSNHCNSTESTYRELKEAVARALGPEWTWFMCLASLFILTYQYCYSLLSTHFFDNEPVGQNSAPLGEAQNLRIPLTPSKSAPEPNSLILVSEDKNNKKN